MTNPTDRRAITRKVGDPRYSSTAVTDYVQSRADSDSTSINFAIRAADESDALQWKKFNKNSELRVRYDFPPTTPTGLSVAGEVECPGKPRYIATNEPTLKATAPSNYAAAETEVALYFEVHTAGGNRSRYNSYGLRTNEGATGSWRVTTTSSLAPSNSTTPLPEGGYTFQVKAGIPNPTYPDQQSPFTTPMSFTVDTTAPTGLTIASHDYPPSFWGATGGTFQASATGAAAFQYRWDTDEPLAIPASQCNYTTTGYATAVNGKATITEPGLAPGFHRLTVVAFDDAHNTTAQVEYRFYVAQNFGLGSGRVEAESAPMTATPPAVPAGAIALRSVESGAAWSSSQRAAIAASTGSESAPTTFAFSFTAPADAYYALGAQVGTDSHYGIVSFDIDGAGSIPGQPLLVAGSSTSFDSYSATAGSRYLMLGGLRLTAGTHTIRLKVIGKNPASTSFVLPTGQSDNGYSAAVDYFTVLPIANVTFPSLTAAFNNDGVVSTGVLADIEPSANNRSLPLSLMQSAGMGPGQVLTLGPVGDQVSFSLPSRTNAANEMDNVVSAGQVIALPANSGAGFVNLLVMSTCGSVIDPSALPGTDPKSKWPTPAISVSYMDPSEPDGDVIRDRPLPTVPGWLDTPVGATRMVNTEPVAWSSTAATLPAANAGLTSDSTLKPTVYRLKFKTHPDHSGQRISAVTLPNVGTDMTQGCRTPALHVFAIALS